MWFIIVINMYKIDFTVDGFAMRCGIALIIYFSSGLCSIGGLAVSKHRPVLCSTGLGLALAVRLLFETYDEFSGYLFYSLPFAGIWLFAATRVVRGWMYRPVNGPICASCGYSLAGLRSGSCPECGAHFTAEGQPESITSPPKEPHG